MSMKMGKINDIIIDIVPITEQALKVVLKGNKICTL